MDKNDQIKDSSEVPVRVFNEFLKQLEKSGVSLSVIERLRVLLFSEKGITEKAIAEALLSEEQLP